MVWEVVVSFCISLIETTVPINPANPTLGISSIAPWIIAVGVFIPNRPAWTLVIALAAATTWPIAYAHQFRIARFSAPPLGQVATWPFFNYLFAILAYLIGRRMYGITIAGADRARAGKLSARGTDW